MVYKLAVILLLIPTLAWGGRPALTVGSRDSVEEIILAKILVHQLRAKDYQVRDMTGLRGRKMARQALLEGRLDVCLEFIGSALKEHHGLTRVPHNPSAGLQLLRQKEVALTGLVWLAKAPLNRTYQVMTGPVPKKAKNRMTKISRLTQLSGKAKKRFRLGLSSDFFIDPAGYRALIKTYGLKLSPNQVRKTDPEIIYDALAEGLLPAGVGISTHGLIEDLKLTVLADDRSAFEPNNPAPVVRKEALKRFPGLAAELARVMARLTTKEMIRLNREVRFKGQTPEQAAKAWVRAQDY